MRSGRGVGTELPHTHARVRTHDLSLSLGEYAIHDFGLRAVHSRVLLVDEEGFCERVLILVFFFELPGGPLVMGGGKSC